MKLLSKTNFYYIIFSIATYLIIGASVYFTVVYLIYREVEERLLVEKKDFDSYIKKYGKWENSCYFVETKIAIRPVPANAGGEDISYSNISLYNKYDQNLVPFRQICFFKKIDGINYKICIRKSLLESNMVIKYLTGIMLGLLSVALVIMYVFQQYVSKNIWHPFYNTLNKIRAFELNSNEKLILTNGAITEFEDLNEVFQKMIGKMKQDYQSLKDFTENASHEMQTPIALINARIDELIQSKSLTEKQVYLIQQIHDSSLRMSKLHHALLMLAKIENKQYYEKIIVNLGALAEKKVKELEELFLHKNIQVTISKKGTFKVEMNPVLADSMLTNLIGNAVKHNFKDGKINIEILNNVLVLSNTGNIYRTTTDGLFERFSKGNINSDSPGLGLAIVRNIGKNFNLEIEYTIQDNLHTFKIYTKEYPSTNK